MPSIYERNQNITRMLAPSYRSQPDVAAKLLQKSIHTIKKKSSTCTEFTPTNMGEFQAGLTSGLFTQDDLNSFLAGTGYIAVRLDGADISRIDINLAIATADVVKGAADRHLNHREVAMITRSLRPAIVAGASLIHAHMNNPSSEFKLGR